MVNHPAWYRRNKQLPLVCIDAGPDTTHGRDLGDSPFRPANELQLRRRNEVLNSGHFAGSSVWHVQKRHKVLSAGVYRNASQMSWRQELYNMPTPLTRYLSYHSDKLSRLALPSELSEHHSPCGIRSLAEGCAIGAHFAEAANVQAS
jgi:hypothetical protein